MDISPDMNSIASERIAAAGLGDRVDVFEGDATALVFADATFDAAVSMQVIEYLAEPDAALHQLVRVLRPGGRLVIIDTDWDSLVWAATDRRRAAADRGRVERAPARPLPSALARAPPPRGRIRGQRNPDRPDAQHGLRRHDLQLQHRPAHRRIRARGSREASQKTRQPNGSTTSQNYSSKGATSSASTDTSSPLRAKRAAALAPPLVPDDRASSPVRACGNVA